MYRSILSSVPRANFQHVFWGWNRFPWRKTAKMANSVLVQKFNPSTGKLEWELQKENYDFVQEIARAGFADMLHDEERKTIQSFISQGKVARVLDIGTGTGLLSIMAAKLGASEVTACETFQPMATCARAVIAHNGCTDKIHLIPKMSTNITVGPEGDMTHRANILVTEVFDTELIGEGAIGTFNHANQHLLTEDSVVIPARGQIFVQLVECDLAYSWNRIKPMKVKDQVILPPAGVHSCPGNGAVHDLQLAQLHPSQFKAISNPVPIFRFDWNSKEPILKDDQKSIVLSSVADGTVHGILMWWTLDMDSEGDIVLSCAPPWAHPEGDKLPWREHWMQAFYYLPADVVVKSAGVQLELTGYHDEYSLWFSLKSTDEPSHQCARIPRPFCNCSVHLAVSRPRLGQINDEKRTAKYVQALQKVVHPETICLTLGDCCHLSLIVSKLGARKVYAIEPNPHCRRVLEGWIKTNRLEEIVHVLDGDESKMQLDAEVNLLLSEPVFGNSILPWHNFYFAHRERELQHLLAKDVTVMPNKAFIYALAIELKDLWKIRAPVGATQGVDLTHFDKLIMGAVDASDSQLEPHPLWEYPCRALSAPVCLMTVDFLALPTSEEIHGRIDLPVPGSLNGVAMWIDWQLDETASVSSGPTMPPTLGQNIKWDIHSKQAVYFIKEPMLVGGSGSCTHSLKYRAKVLPDTYDFSFLFSPE